jgi:hypothetical protein
MALLVVSWLIYDGAIRVHAINALGRRKGRVIEVEVVDTGERFHGSARRLKRLVHRLRRYSGELDQVPVWKAYRTL